MLSRKQKTYLVILIMILNTNTAVLCPKNDLESIRIIQIAKSNGYCVFEGPSQWGKTLKHCSKQLHDFYQSEYSQLIVIELPDIDNKESRVATQYGKSIIEVDHHKYSFADKSKTQSSIEQFCKLTNIKMTIEDEFIAAYDKGFVFSLISQTNASFQQFTELRNKELKIQGIYKLFNHFQSHLAHVSQQFRLHDVQVHIIERLYSKVASKVLQSPSKQQFDEARNENELILPNFLIAVVNHQQCIQQVEYYGTESELLKKLRKVINTNDYSYWEGGSLPNLFLGTEIFSPLCIKKFLLELTE